MKSTLLSVLVLIGLTASCASRPVAQAWQGPEHIVLDPGTSVVLATSLEETTPATPAPATQPAAHPALPAGHPDISAAAPATQPAGSAALPKGHPDISSMMGGNSPGGMGGAGAQLPSGHPDISALMNRDAGGAKTTSMIVKAQQATIGGPAVQAANATVEIYSHDQVVAKLEAKLDETGQANITGVPVGPAYQPLVTVDYQGITYQAVGAPITATPQTVTVNVYEPTDQPVGWEVRMRHIMLQPTAEGVQVIDMLAIDNATDRTFVGTEGADGKRTTFTLPISPDARDIKFANGFHDCCTKVENGQVINTTAIVPGTNQYQLMYFVPLKSGQAEIIASAPAVTKHFIVFAPDDGTTIKGEGLESGKTSMGNGTTRYFKSMAVPAGQTINLVVSGTPTRSAAAGAARPTTFANMNSAQLAKTVAGVGGLLIFLIGGALFFRRSGNGSIRSTKEVA